MSSFSTFSSSIASFEESSKTPMYTVYEITEKGSLLTSTFDSKSRAFKFANDFTHKNSQIYIYKSKCIQVLESPLIDDDEGLQTLAMAAASVEPVTTTPTEPLVDYASEDDADYVPNEAEANTTEFTGLEGCLDGLTFTEYGRGYLLSPTDDTPFYGEPYLLDGWWNEAASGWFFKSEFYDELIHFGAVYVASPTKSKSKTKAKSGKTATKTKSAKAKSSTKSSKSSKASVIDPSTVFTKPCRLDGFALSTYGKGLVATCAHSHPLYVRGVDYLVGNLGFWNANADGWFFKHEHLEALEALGAKFIKQEPVSNGPISLESDDETEEGEYTCADMEFSKKPKFSKYGRGFLLKADSKYTYKNLGKYFEGGFWMPKQKGWFFRKADRDTLLAKY